MRKLKIATIATYNGYLEEDLLVSILKKKYNVEFINDAQNADIILQGAFQNQFSFQTKLNLFLNFYLNRLNHINFKEKKSIKDFIDPHRNKIWIHVSGESPNYSIKSSFLNSECDFGIGHETIVNPNYVRMPHWYQSLDWSNCGFDRSHVAFYRLGSPIKLNELMSGISSSTIKNKKMKCALFASHLTTPRDIFVKEIQKFIEVDIFGINGNRPIGLRSSTTKREVLNNYVFTLCPENMLYPGYITEKTPESFACSSFPLSWYIDSTEPEFSLESHLNIADYGAKSVSCDGTLADLVQKKYQLIKNEGVEPLLYKAPTLEPIIEILDKAITSCF
jgi:hypothetical protein